MTDPRGTRPPEPPNAEKHGRDLQKVNEKLRELISSLKTEKERRAEGRAAAAEPPPAAPPPEPSVDLEKKRLATELALAREAVEHATAERTRLRERLAEIEAENQRMCDEYVAVEARSSEMAQLYVALERIHGGLTREDVLTAVQEIVINVIGTEELAVLELKGDRLQLVQSFGVDPSPLRTVRLGEGALGRAAASGDLYVAGRSGSPDAGDGDLTAAIPLKVGDRVHGVVAIFRLLGHKPCLGEGDQVVFDLLANHVGLALHLRDGRAAG